MRVLATRDYVSALLAATAATSMLWIVPARLAAQDLPPSLAQMAEQRTFNIPAQPLGTALGVFGQQSGRQVTVDGAAVRGIGTPGVQGTMTIDQALQQLLAGTGLTYSFPSGTTIAVQRPDRTNSPGAVQLDPVQVQGFAVPQQAMTDNLPPPYAGGQVATGGQLGLLGNRDVMNTPFNQTSYTAKKALDQQAKTITDVLIDDPSVRSYRAELTPGDQSVQIRGFDYGVQATSYGGLYGMLPSDTIMVELAERVEVFKGPSAMLNGMQPGRYIGGTINIVPKRAPNENLTQVTANYISAGQFGGHVDVARRFGPDKEFGVRFNGVFRGGQTAIENNSDQRGLGIVGLDFRGENVRVSGDFGYQNQYVGGLPAYLGLSPGIPLPWAPNARMNQGQPWNYVQNKDLFGIVRAEVDMTESITAYAALGAHDNRSEGLYTSSNTVTGFYGTTVSGEPLSVASYRSIFTATAGVRGLFDTGPIGHEFSVAATTLDSEEGNGFTFGAPFATNIYNPTVIARPSMPIPATNKAGTQTLSSLALADTLSVANKRVQLTAGFRLQNVNSAFYDTISGQIGGAYDASAVSPSAALVFKPWEKVTLYGNFIQGLQPGQVVSTFYTNAGEIFPPYKSTQYEAGVKMDWGKFTTSVDVFQISQPFTLVNVASNTLSLAGEQRNQGIEFNFFGEPVKGIRLLGGAMFLNPVLTQTQGGTTNGWAAPLTSQVNLNLASEWDLPFVPGLTLNGRVVYTGSQYVDTDWPRRSLPAWTRFDLGARYAFDNPGAKGKLLVARFNVDNVLDANYWLGGGGVTSLSLGAPRIFRLALTADF